jgi:hypothetical protein
MSQNGTANGTGKIDKAEQDRQNRTARKRTVKQGGRAGLLG